MSKGDKEQAYRQCVRCVMDTTDVAIEFDEKGYCNHCRDFLEKKIYWTYQGSKSDEILESHVQKIKKAGLGKKYDCMVGLSGGADSCYTAMVCKRLGLRVLLVHMDNGWDSETSVKNIETICRLLKFDYESHVLNWDEFREVQLAHLRASVPEIETPTDIAILQYLHKSAEKYNVKYIVMGGNYITEGILPKSWHYNAKDKKYSQAILKMHSQKRIGKFPSFGFLEEAYYKYVKGIKIFYILNLVPYNKKEVIKQLEGIGWKNYGEKHHESFYTKIVQSYILPLKFNIDYRKATLSNKICTGDLTREQALELLALSPYELEGIENDIAYVCKKLSIGRTEFEAIMKEPPKSYTDYPNNKKFLEWLYRLYYRFSGTTGN